MSCCDLWSGKLGPLYPSLLEPRQSRNNPNPVSQLITVKKSFPRAVIGTNRFGLKEETNLTLFGFHTIETVPGITFIVWEKEAVLLCVVLQVLDIMEHSSTNEASGKIVPSL